MSQSKLPAAVGYQRKPIRVLNHLLRWMQPTGIGHADLSPQRLLDEACKATGASDFGEDPFREPMDRVLKSLDEEADLNPIGRHIARLSTLRILKHRLWAEHLFKSHPEILEREIVAPVVIVGLARSGTTRLHRLLASDPRFLHLEAWETVNPVPWPESFERKPDPRIKNIDQALKAILYMSPQIASVHPLGTHEVEEEVGLLQHAFSSQLFELQAKVPSFAKWLMENDQTYAYEYMVKLLKLISWFRKDDPKKTWVLKTPQHMQDLDALMRVFPDARLICSHRDPLKAVGSACSMTWNAIVRDSDSIEASWVGSEWFAKTVSMVKKTARVREEMVPTEHQIDVLYADINRDWQEQIRRIYDFIGAPLGDDAKSNMAVWLASNTQHKHGAHKYTLADFGLDSDQVDRELMFYREKYKIPYENAQVQGSPSV